MPDHAEQISKLRDAALRGWVGESSNIERGLFGIAHARRAEAGESIPTNSIAAVEEVASRPEPNSPAERTGAATPGEQATLPRWAGPETGSHPLRPLEPAPAAASTIDDATQKLIKDLRVMKRTRFNAQERFEAKHRASVAAFTLAAIFEIGLSLAGTNFVGTLPKNVASFIEFSAQITAVFILGFGLVATLSNYQTQALYLQRCAMDWGNLSRELQIAQPVSQNILQDFRRRYHEIEGRCPPNHSAQDYTRATVDRSDSTAVRANNLDYFLDVYLVFAVSGIGYIAFFAIGLWQAVS